MTIFSFELSSFILDLTKEESVPYNINIYSNHMCHTAQYNTAFCKHNKCGQEVSTTITTITTTTFTTVNAAVMFVIKIYLTLCCGMFFLGVVC